MTVIERQVVKAQQRLWLNRWFGQWGWCAVIAAAAWLIAWLIDRLFLPGRVPKGWAALAALAASLAASLLWLWRTREQKLAAATALDEAARLRERVSTGLCVEKERSDPFAQAVVADAERVVTGLTARKFIPLRWARSLSFSAILIGAALLSLLLPEIDLLNRGQGKASGQPSDALKHAEAMVAPQMALIKEIEEKHPDLKAEEGNRKFSEPLKPDRELDPDVVRRDAVKKLDRMEDMLKQKAAEDRFKALNETKDRLKQLGEPSDPKSEVGQLMEAMANGDFQAAQQAIKKTQEQLAKRAADGKLDPKKAEEMRDQLNDLAKKMEKAAQDKQSERELQNAGMSKEEAQRVLEALAKKDPQQLEKMAKEMAERLKSQGMTEEQMKEMMKKIQQRQEACKQCEGLGNKMGQAAKNIDSGATESADAQLAEAGEMLNEMEQLEQTLNDMQSQMSELDQARDQLNKNQSDDEGECEMCNGTGFRKDGSVCPACKGSGRKGGQGGKGGQGKGKSRGPGSGTSGGGHTDPRDDSVKTSTVDTKAKTKTRKDGTVIGQDFVKGKMLTGKSEVEFYDAAKAAEIDATDTVDNPRIPRIYRKGVKAYFDRLAKEATKGGKAESEKSDGTKSGASKPDGTSGEAKGDGAKVEGDKSGSDGGGASGGDSSKEKEPK